jgi:hypothetical protein
MPGSFWEFMFLFFLFLFHFLFITFALQFLFHFSRFQGSFCMYCGRGFYLFLIKNISINQGRCIQVPPISLFFTKNFGIETDDSLLGGVNNSSVTAGMVRKLCPCTHGCPISPGVGVQIEIAS